MPPMYENSTVEDVMTEIYLKERIPPDQQRIIWAGRQLDPRTNNVLHLNEDTTMHLVLRLRGGARTHRTEPPTPEEVQEREFFAGVLNRAHRIIRERRLARERSRLARRMMIFHRLRRTHSLRRRNHLRMVMRRDEQPAPLPRNEFVDNDAPMMEDDHSEDGHSTASDHY